ncbi:MAG: 16S rRNA (uracil(1498)-N(3))-methyltransferase [Phycicoccus sp.]|nr:16S rRNA (uracil(1498)-N(3))-methyltransferase [Phycicoccus sp.]NMM35123.1 16S rRNA (uracil(1498)-N(3))-methyltransferase [Phycicoccus sp.]
MTAPLFFVSADRLAGAAAGALFVLDGSEGRHAATVKRIGVGEQVLLADGVGHRAETIVEGVGPGELHLRVQAITLQPQPDSRFVLVQALAKGDRDEQAIEAATELGVDEVVPWQAARSVVIWRGERATRSLRKWESIVLAAAKQSRRTRVPVVSEPANNQAVIQRISEAALALVLHEDAERALAGFELPSSGDVVLIVGPEGGISPDELSAFVAAGAVMVRLGSNILRSSSAGPAALAVMSAASRWR